MDRVDRKMKHILLVLREPFLDRIPSLKTLVWFLLNHNHRITLITSESNKFILLSFDHENLQIIKVKQRSKRFESPTTLKLLWKTLSFVLTRRVDYLMGGDAIGNISASKISRLLVKKHIFFMLEYPQIITEKVQCLTRLQRLENKSLEKSDIIITHDKWHKQFLLTHFNLNNKILLLPNSSFTPEIYMESNFLQMRLGVQGQKIVLHSGGFGKWFKCKELADSTYNWDKNVKLVFHVSHRVEDDKYFEEVYESDYRGKVLFSLNPVSTYELDSLVASADVGIALYSEKELGYRATYMGLAAGKIGNYLKCGVPIIATKLLSLSYIETYQCGILVEKEKDIASAINKILSNRDMYSKNAYRCYRELWHPESYLKKVGEII